MAQWLHDLIQHYGTLGVGVAAGAEGETAVVVGGALARHGLFSPWLAGIAAWLGSFVADQIFFLIGRWRRDGPWVGKVRARPVFARAIDAIDRHPLVFCLAFRFVYGCRIAGPVAIGVSDVPARLFVGLNLLSAAIWAAVFTFLGYRFGKAFEALLARLLTPVHLAIVAGVLLMAGLAVYAWHRRRAALTNG